MKSITFMHPITRTLILVVLLHLAGCSKPPASNGPTAEVVRPPSPIPFKAEAYRTIDDRRVVTFVSSDELELRGNGMNLICKYTKQSDQYRVTASFNGTPQALYFRITPEGLQNEEGITFLSTKSFVAAREQMQMEQARQDQARRLAQEKEEKERVEEQERQRIESARIQKLMVGSKVATKTVGKFKAAGRFGIANLVITDCSVSIDNVLGKPVGPCWFGDIKSVSTYGAWIVSVGLRTSSQQKYGLLEMPVEFANEAGAEEYHAKLVEQIDKWREKYADVERQRAKEN
jgi:hypothetical protein